MKDLASLPSVPPFRHTGKLGHWDRQWKSGRNYHKNYSLAKYATLDT
jgi:hypothetical protein